MQKADPSTGSKAEFSPQQEEKGDLESDSLK